MRFFLPIAIAAIALSGPAQASPLLTNGGFEAGDFTGWTTNFTPPSDVARIITEADYAGRVHEGTYSVNFSFSNVPATAIISQGFTTVLGETYNVSFDFGTVASPDRSPTLRVDVLGNDDVAVLASHTYARAGTDDIGTVTWSDEGFSFMADGTAARLVFADLTDPSFASDALLDDVRIAGSGDLDPEPISEPMSAAFLVAAFATLLCARRCASAGVRV